MTIPIAFTKVSGAGNDFVVINNFRGNVAVDFPTLARIVCDRHFGVGADGLLVVEKSNRVDFAMRYYNADGSWGGMCGNGGRCLARFALLEGIAGAKQKFEALEHIYDAEVREESVSLLMKEPSGFRAEVPLDLRSVDREIAFLDTGSPHVVIVANAGLEDVEVPRIGKEIRHHPQFAPEGTNVNWIARENPATIRIRTYERGVEDETLACGTGAVASALVAAHRYRMKSPVTVAVRSGENLYVHFSGEAGHWTGVRLEGSAHMLFTGTFAFETDPPALHSVT